MEGTSFAIPINRVKEIMAPLSEGRPVQHGYLGLSLASCTPDWAHQQNNANMENLDALPEVYGALVHKVFPQTPAESGGLRPNDVILNIGGKPVRSSDDARRWIDRAPVGQDLKMTILRNHVEMLVTVQPVDLVDRLREAREEQVRQRQREWNRQQERLRFHQELGPFRLQ